MTGCWLYTCVAHEPSFQFTGWTAPVSRYRVIIVTLQDHSESVSANLPACVVLDHFKLWYTFARICLIVDHQLFGDIALMALY